MTLRGSWFDQSQTAAYVRLRCAMLCNWPAFMCYVHYLLPCMPTPHASDTPHTSGARNRALYINELAQNKLDSQLFTKPSVRIYPMGGLRIYPSSHQAHRVLYLCRHHKVWYRGCVYRPPWAYARFTTTIDSQGEPQTMHE